MKAEVCTGFQMEYKNSKLQRGTISELYSKCVTLASIYTLKYDFKKYFTPLWSGLTSFFCYKANKRGVILVIFECELKTLILGHRVNSVSSVVEI